MKKIYPRTGDTQTVYLNAVVKDPLIEVGDYTIYNDFNSWRCSCQTDKEAFHGRYNSKNGNIKMGGIDLSKNSSNVCLILQVEILTGHQRMKT